MELTLSLLGDTEIKLNGKSLENLSAQKACALLFFLAVESDHAHQREALAEMFWPEKPEGYGRNSLKQTLALLRGALGDRDLDDPFLISSNRDLQFNTGSNHWVDVLEFEKLVLEVNSHTHDGLNTCEPCFQKLVQAAALYQDEYLVDFYLSDSPEFNEWVISKREAYKRMIADVFGKLISYHEAQKDFKNASMYGEKLLNLEPWNESSHRILMGLLAACGKRSAALKQYHACENMLKSEFGVKPAPETIALYEKIQHWNVGEWDWKKNQFTTGEGILPSKIDGTSTHILQLRGWIIGSAVISFLVLMGIIYTVLFKKDNQGNFPPSGPSRTPKNTPVLINGDPSLFILLGAPSDTLTSQTCLPGEELLYLEDFEDNHVQGWPEIEFRVQGWDLVPDPILRRNMVIQNPVEHVTQIVNHDLIVENAVWRLNFMIQGKPSYTFHWYWNLDPYEGKDGIVLSSGISTIFGTEGIRVVRGMYPDPEVVILDIPLYVEQDVWHVIEISTYLDTFELWIDGIQIVEFIDPDPLPGGLIGLELWPSQTEDSMVYFDNFQVCELSGPFVPLYSAEQ